MGALARWPRTRPEAALARRRLVVDDEAEVPPAVGRTRASFCERDELVADVDEGHPRGAAAQRELEDRAVEIQRLVDAPDLERDVVDADEARQRVRHERRVRTRRPSAPR